MDSSPAYEISIGSAVAIEQVRDRERETEREREAEFSLRRWTRVRELYSVSTILVREESYRNSNLVCPSCCLFSRV